MSQKFETALSCFLASAQAICDAEKAAGRCFTAPQLSTEPGRRYVRIIAKDDQWRSAFGFVDTTNGDVLKAADWKAPAKGARGNIYDDRNGIGRVRWTGVH